MYSIIDQQLNQIKVRELMQEAAEARADRKARKTHRRPVTRSIRVALAAAPVVVWAVWAFILH